MCVGGVMCLVSVYDVRNVESVCNMGVACVACGSVTFGIWYLCGFTHTTWNVSLCGI